MSQNNGINTMPSMTAAAGFRLLFALSLLVPAGYFAVSALESRQRTLREADQHIVTTVRLLSEQMNKVLQMDDLALTQVDELVRGMSWDEIRQSARLLPALHDQIVAIMIAVGVDAENGVGLAFLADWLFRMPDDVDSQWRHGFCLRAGRWTETGIASA